jgi:hypothetical protein
MIGTIKDHARELLVVGLPFSTAFLNRHSTPASGLRVLNF